jgi:riboflavin kinase/FMN adenylyltransferase
MEIEEELSQFIPERGTWLTIGVFDGVHLGHQHLFSELRKQAANSQCLSGVVTFRQHPATILSPKSQLPYLTTLEERLAILQSLGVELIVPLSFTTELSQLSAEHFVGLLQKYLKMQGLVIGHDFVLGRGREGDANLLGQLGEKMGFALTVIPPKKVNGEIISSTAIRQMLIQGDIAKASQLLGHRFALSGTVVYGSQRGKYLGFPTANLEVDSNQALPTNGVYTTLTHLNDSLYPSVTNIGQRPTFGPGSQTIEVYLFDFAAELYGQEVKIELVERLRGEKKFTSPGELKAQIEKDVAQAREFFRHQAQSFSQN